MHILFLRNGQKPLRRLLGMVSVFERRVLLALLVFLRLISINISHRKLE